MLGLYICGIESKSFVKCLRFTLKCQTTTHFAFSFTKIDIFDPGGTDIFIGFKYNESKWIVLYSCF